MHNSYYSTHNGVYKVGVELGGCTQIGGGAGVHVATPMRVQDILCIVSKLSRSALIDHG